MTTGERQNGMTYAEAGVDIDAGNALVEAIKPLVRATRRPGADAEIGGFGGLFDLKAAGFKDAILVAANDGVGTKVKIAIETGRHATIGIDLVAMCVNDIIVQGAEPLFFLDYYATGKLVPGVGADIVKGIAEGCRQAGCALIGGETAEMPGLYDGSDYDLAGFSVGAAERGALCRSPASRPATWCSACPRRACTRTGSRWYAGSWRPRAWLRRARPVRGRRQPRRGAAGADPDLRQAAAGGAEGDRPRRHQGARPHHRRRLSRQPAPRPARRRRHRHRPRRGDGAPGLRLARPPGQRRRGRDAAHLQLRHRHGGGGRSGQGRSGGAGASRPARRRCGWGRSPRGARRR